MAMMERGLNKRLWVILTSLVLGASSAFAFYYNEQTEKLNKIAVSSIKADERLEKRLKVTEDRQIRIESQQAAMGAKLEANMKWLIDACSRIETRQARIEDRLEKRD